MFRGEFIRADGLVIPNNVTRVGTQTLLAAALRNTVPTFNVGLVDAAPDPELVIGDVIEPSAANGYARIAVTRDSTGWPTTGLLNGEPFFETDWLTWLAVGGPFDHAVRRLMLVTNANDILALSTAMPSDLVINPSTPENNRRFKYRLYAR